MEVFEIETERLQLRQFRVEDAQDVFAIFSDEQTTLDCGGYHAFDAMDEEYDRLMQKFAGQTRYSVVRKADGRVIGVISLMDAERAVPGWELPFYTIDLLDLIAHILLFLCRQISVFHQNDMHITHIKLLGEIGRASCRERV